MPHSKRTSSGVLGGLLGLIGLSAVAGVLITATVTPAVAVTSAAATGAIDMFNNLPSVLQIDKLILPSKIYYTDDKGKNTLMATYYDQNRTPVTFNEINTVMYDALLSSEDPRYYEHGGIDLIGTARALLSNVKGGAPTQGGSSISQQYVKNVQLNTCYWSAENDQELNACWLKASDNQGADGYQRKLQEMRYAISLEQRYSKNDILLGYLNIANFGGTTYGIEAAAWHYFGVHAKDLNLSQAATLAGMVQNPNTYRIDMPGGSVTTKSGAKVNSEKDGYKLAKDRQTYVLDRMLKDGKITQKQHDDAVKAPIVPRIKDARSGCTGGSAAYFCAYVTAVIKKDPAFGPELLQKGGLSIYTTLDPRVQKAAQKAQDDWAPSSQPNMAFGSTSVSVEVSTGRVLAMAQNTTYTPTATDKKGTSAIVYAGSRDLGGSSGFNAGSTFKLFTLLDWLEQGKSLNQVVDGRKMTRSTWKDHCVAGGVVTAPADIPNYNKEPGRFGTPMSFTKQSLNTGFMGMAQQLDLCDIGNVAQRLGVTRGDGTPIPLTTDGTNKDSNQNPQPAEVIGSDNVSPLAMAAAYAAVANKGVYCQPKVIDKVTDADGKELAVPKTTCTQVLDPKVAATAAYALKGPLERGGSGQAGNPWDGTPLIGKTGTHNALQTWLITSNTKVTTANWVGNADGGAKTKPDIFHRYYKGYQLSSLRYPIARSVQGAIDKIYQGGSFPQPDSSLTRQVLVDLPDVVGQTVDEATQTLQDKGFQVIVGQPVDSDQPTDVVAAQSPAAGRTAGGTTVTLSPSNGKGISVPDVTGQDPAQAVATLRGAGFSSVSTTCEQQDGADGTVTGTDPPANTMAGPGTKITVTYAAGDCGGNSPGNGPGNGNGKRGH